MLFGFNLVIESLIFSRISVSVCFEKPPKCFNLVIESLIFSRGKRLFRDGYSERKFQSRNRESYLFKVSYRVRYHTLITCFNLVIESLIFSRIRFAKRLHKSRMDAFQSRNRESYLFKVECYTCYGFTESRSEFQSRNRESYLFKI